MLPFPLNVDKYKTFSLVQESATSPEHFLSGDIVSKDIHSVLKNVMIFNIMQQKTTPWDVMVIQLLQTSTTHKQYDKTYNP